MPKTARTSPRFGLFVGNGLAIDLVGSLTSDFWNRWDPSMPLTWCKPAHAPSWRPRPLLSYPSNAALREYVGDLRAAHPGAPDFKICELIAKRSGLSVGDSTPYHHYAQHYLANAFAYFSHACQPHINDNWRWFRWLAANISSIDFVVSLNYDLTLEHAVTAIGANVSRCGLQNEYGGLRVYKPHGSLDFEYVDAHPGIRVFDSYVPQKSIPPEHHFNRRSDVNIVLPGTPSRLRQHDVAHPGFEEFRATAASIDKYYFVGVSYADVDRSEIDAMLDELRPGTTVIAANPSPSPEFRDAVAARALDYSEWKAGPA